MTAAKHGCGTTLVVKGRRVSCPGCALSWVLGETGGAREELDISCSRTINGESYGKQNGVEPTSQVATALGLNGTRRIG